MTATSKIQALAPVLRKEHGLHRTPENIAALRRFAAAVVAKRTKKGLSRPAFAAKVGVSYFTINHIEHFENWPTVPVYIKMCKVLGVRVPPLME